MALYESVIITRQDISTAQVDGIIDSLAEVIREKGGDVKKKEYWGLRNFAFRINKNRKGHYVLLNLDCSSAAVLEIERRMRLSEDVLRYMTVRVDELEEGPSIMMQNKDKRDDRGPNRGRGGRGGNRKPQEGAE
jgi:small subunit ribosomal protein S6